MLNSMVFHHLIRSYFFGAQNYKKKLIYAIVANLPKNENAENANTPPLYKKNPLITCTLQNKSLPLHRHRPSSVLGHLVKHFCFILSIYKVLANFIDWKE